MWRIDWQQPPDALAGWNTTSAFRLSLPFPLYHSLCQQLLLYQLVRPVQVSLCPLLLPIRANLLVSMPPPLPNCCGYWVGPNTSDTYNTLLPTYTTYPTLPADTYID
jgi:hypothetical protein